MTVFIVEDHHIVREVLSQLIRGTLGMGLGGVAASGEEALEQFVKVQADLLLVDVSLPGMSGIDLVRTVLERWPEQACLMLSAHRERSYVERAIAAGAKGYVLKDEIGGLSDALQQVADGGIYLSPSLRGNAR